MSSSGYDVLPLKQVHLSLPWEGVENSKSNSPDRRAGSNELLQQGSQACFPLPLAAAIMDTLPGWRPLLHSGSFWEYLVPQTEPSSLKETFLSGSHLIAVQGGSTPWLD